MAFPILVFDRWKFGSLQFPTGWVEEDTLISVLQRSLSNGFVIFAGVTMFALFIINYITNSEIANCCNYSCTGQKKFYKS